MFLCFLFLFPDPTDNSCDDCYAKYAFICNSTAHGIVFDQSADVINNNNNNNNTFLKLYW